MASITVTIGDNTKGPFSLASLFATPAPAGVTVLPSTPLSASKRPTYVSVQADAANAALFVYVGDSKIAAGTSRGAKLAAGQSNTIQNQSPPWALSTRYVNGDNTAVINIEVLGGS